MLERLFARGGRGGARETGWAMAVSASGDVLISFPEASGAFKTPMMVVDADGSVSLTDAKGGVKAVLSGSAELAPVAASQSVIVAVPRKGVLTFSAAPVVRKGQKPSTSFSKGKIHRVTVERVVDDGSVTGVWRGFVSLHAGLQEVFLELVPPFPIPAGSRIRIVGLMDAAGHGPDGGVRMRFRLGAWVPLADRGVLFTEGGKVRLTTSMDPGGRSAWSTMETTLSELSLLRHREKGTKTPLPMTRIRMQGGESAAQMGLRSRLASLNTGIFRNGSARGRRMRIPSTEWHGAVQKNGDIVLEVRREPFAEAPEKVTVILNREVVTTADGRPSRIGLRCRFRDGTAKLMLLGGGPQALVAEMARRKTVVVVQGMPGAETYADVHVSIADVEKL